MGDVNLVYTRVQVIPLVQGLTSDKSPVESKDKHMNLMKITYVMWAGVFSKLISMVLIVVANSLLTRCFDLVRD